MNEEQLHFPGFEQYLETQETEKVENKEPSKTLDNPPAKSSCEIDAPALAVQQNALPASLKDSAETSITLRNIQRRVAEILTREDYLALIASTKPEVLPELFDSLTGGISVSDNLMIKTMQEASKNANANRLLEYMVEQKKQSNQESDNSIDTIADQCYNDSIDKIKRAVYHKLDTERNKSHKTSKDFIDKKDIDVIDADYQVKEEDEDK